MTWIAVDWGISRLRAWVHDDADLIAELCSDDGTSNIGPDQFEPALLRLIEPYLNNTSSTQVICLCTLGGQKDWFAPLCASVPAKPFDLRRMKRVNTKDPRISLHHYPGMSQTRPHDVMGGAVAQIAGFMSAHPDWDGIVCLTGIHTKWVHLSAGEIVSFKSFMTGEIVALLSDCSALRDSIGSAGWNDDAFEQAISDAMSRPERLAGALSSMRAESLLENLDPTVARARLSGTLIGMELAAARPYWLGQNVALIGEGEPAIRYAEALKLQGVIAPLASAEDMMLSGLRQGYAALRENS